MTTKLLAVDDSKTMRKVLEITFAGDTYDSTIVGSADEALAAVRANPPQLAIVDGHLGNASGYDLCQQIKAAAPSTKVLLLSSKQRPFDAAKAAEVGVDEHFDKPFDSTKFLDKLGQIELGAAAPAQKAPAAEPPRPASAAPARPPAPAPAAAAPRPAPAPSLTSKTSPGLSPRAPAVSSATPVPAVSAPAASPPKPAPQPAPSPAVEPPVAPAQTPAPASAPVAAAVGGSMTEKLQGMGLTPEQVAGVLSLSKEVVEQVVWEVVPQLAETMIKEEIARLTAD